MQLKPWEFWRLTPWEFDLMLAGFFRREDRAWQRAGALGVWISSQYSKKKLSIEKVLGRTLTTLPPYRP